MLQERRVDLLRSLLLHPVAAVGDAHDVEGARHQVPVRVDELLAQGRRVYLVMDKFYPQKLKARLLEGRQHRNAHVIGTLVVKEILK